MDHGSSGMWIMFFSGASTAQAVSANEGEEQISHSRETAAEKYEPINCSTTQCQHWKYHIPEKFQVSTGIARANI